MKGAKSPFLLLLSVVLLLSLPSVARADSFAHDVSDFVTGWYPHVVWSEDYSVQGNIDDYRHIIIDAASVNDAALLAISVGPSGVNNDVRAFLSDNRYSPHFANLVGSLSVMGDWDGFPSWAPSYVRSMCLDPTNCYVGTLDTYDVKQAYKEYLAAKQYAEDGTLPSGTGGSFSVDDYYMVDAQSWSDDYAQPTTIYEITAQNATVSGSELVVGSGNKVCSGYINSPNYVDNARFYLSPNVVGIINSFINAHCSVCIGNDGFYASDMDFNLRVVRGDHPFYSMDENLTYLRSGGGISDYQIEISPYYYDGELFIFVDAVKSSFTTHKDGYWTPQYFTAVFNSPISVSPSGDWSEPEPSAKWGVDIDWYDDTAEAPTGGTDITIGGDTVYNTENNTYTTNYTLDVEPILQRLDKLNLMVAQIGIDLRTIDSDLVSGFSSVSNYLSQVVSWMRANSSILSRILDKMDELDKSTNDLVDLSSLESGVSALSGDIDVLLSAVTGSHGADALGVYGRLDTVLNWLDDYTPVDVSGIQSILEDWPDYPTFDDSDLLNAITGSHGSDLLGLFGRLDNVLSWLDSYVAPDLATLNHQLGDFTESDGQTLTVHGLLHWINYYAQDIDRALSEWPEQVATDLTVLNHQLGDVVESDGQTLTVHGLLHWINYYAQDIDRAVQDILALGTVTVDGTTYGFADLAYNTWLDLLRLVGMSSVTADGHTYSFADLLYNMWLDLGQYCNDFVEYWSEVVARLDGVIDAIEDLPHSGTNPWRSTPVSEPDNPTSIVPVGPTTLTPYGYPELPDWETYREPLNIPALEHAIDELMQKFPFSMLNTIVQVAAFIERPAVAPQFDVPAPNPSDWSQPYMVHIDLSEYDTVAATLRLGIVIWAIVRISNRTIKMWVGDKAVE